MNTNPKVANTKVTKATQEVTMRRDTDLRDLSVALVTFVYAFLLLMLPVFPGTSEKTPAIINHGDTAPADRDQRPHSHKIP